MHYDVPLGKLDAIVSSLNDAAAELKRPESWKLVDGRVIAYTYDRFNKEYHIVGEVKKEQLDEWMGGDAIDKYKKFVKKS
jgi:hypothetical protein